MLRAVIELKQAALWHGGKIRIDQACEAAAEGMVRQRKHFEFHFDQKRLEHYPALIKSTQNHYRLHIYHLEKIVVRSGVASNEWWNVSRTEFNGCKRFERVWRQLCVAT